MPYIRRDDDGHINALVDDPEGPGAEEASIGDPEVLAFLFGDDMARAVPDGCVLHAPQCLEMILGLHEHRKLFEQSDLALVRVLEDLITLLVDKGVLRYTDLPAAAQGKLRQRQQVRIGTTDQSPVIEGEDVL